MESKVTVKWFLQNWSQILVWVGTAGAVILFLLPWSRGGPAAWFFVFMAVMAVLNIILPIPNKLHDLEAAMQGQFRPKRYPDMAGAKDDIILSIIKCAQKLGQAPLPVRIVGMRLRAVREVLALVLAKEDMRNIPMTMTLYHIDPDTLAGWRNPSDPSSDVFQKEAAMIPELIEDIRSLVKRTKVSVNFVGFKEHPMFHGWIIGEEEMFWGYAIWDEHAHTFKVAHNPCFHIRKADEYFGDLMDWALNRCLVYDQWSQVNQYADLGYMGSLPDRQSMGEVVANLPDDTRLVRMLAFSGDFNFQNSGALKRLEELMKNHQTKIEYLTIDPESPFVPVRTQEHKEWNESSLQYRVTLCRNRITTLLENIEKDKGGDREGGEDPISFSQWAVWRLMFVNDDIVYAMFYPVGQPSKYPKVWIFKRDEEGRSMFWPLLKEYYTHKYYSHQPANSLSPDEITRKILKEMPQYF